MEIELNFFNLSHLAAMSLGLASGMVLLYFAIKHNSSLLPLSFGQVSLASALVINFLIINQLLVHFSFLYRFGNVFAWIYVPLPYLYLQLHLSNRRFQWMDLVHFIPLLVYVVDFWPMFILSNEEKLAMILQEDAGDLNNYNQSRFFPPGFHAIIRAVFVNAYWIAQVVLLKKWFESRARMSPKEKIWWRWIVTMTAFQFFLFFPFYVSLFWANPMLSYHLVNSVGSLILLASSMMVFFYPSVLYYQLSQKKRALKTGSSKEIESATGNLPDDLQNPELAKTLEEKLSENNRFLNIRYSIHDFAEDTGLPAYLISQYLNHHLQMTFVDFVNKKRIQYCVEQFENGRFMAFSMDAVAKECGFNNRNSFTKAFQKFQGKSPSDFRKVKIGQAENKPDVIEG
jgi:AraC-like DNA-binding protein